MTNVLPKTGTSKSDSQIASEVTGIMFSLDRQLKHKTNFIACSIEGARHRQMPGLVIIREIKEMIRDNERAMQSILGNDLLTRIKNFRAYVSQ